MLGLAQFAIRDQDREKKLEFIFSIYDMDRDGLISNGELFKVRGSECLQGNNSGFDRNCKRPEVYCGEVKQCCVGSRIACFLGFTF